MKIKVKAEIKIETLPYNNELYDGVTDMCEAISECPIIDNCEIGCKMCAILFDTGNAYNKENYNKLIKKLKDGEIVK